MSKGSRPRPYSVDQKKFESNWQQIFGSKEKQQPVQQKTEKEKTNELGRTN